MTGLSMDQLVSILSNAPAAGILALIAYFLYKHIPKWVDKHFDKHFGYLESLSAAHKEEVKDLTATFKAELREEREQCMEYNDKLAKGIEESNRATVQAFKDLTFQVSAHDAHVRMSLDRLERQSEAH